MINALRRITTPTLRGPTGFHDAYFGDRTVSITTRHVGADLVAMIGHPAVVAPDVLESLLDRFAATIAALA